MKGGSLESLVRREISEAEHQLLRDHGELGTLERGRADAVAAREALNSHLGRLQRAIGEFEGSRS